MRDTVLVFARLHGNAVNRPWHFPPHRRVSSADGTGARSPDVASACASANRKFSPPTLPQALTGRPWGLGSEHSRAVQGSRRTLGQNRLAPWHPSQPDLLVQSCESSRNHGGSKTHTIAASHAALTAVAVAVASAHPMRSARSATPNRWPTPGRQRRCHPQRGDVTPDKLSSLARPSALQYRLPTTASLLASSSMDMHRPSEGALTLGLQHKNSHNYPI